MHMVWKQPRLTIDAVYGPITLMSLFFFYLLSLFRFAYGEQPRRFIQSAKTLTSKKAKPIPALTTRRTMASSQSKKTDVKTEGQKQPSQNERDPLFIWSSLVAGAGSGALASIVCAPLDLIRTRLQVWGELTGEANKKSILNVLKDIVTKEGIQGCFRGLGATLMTVPLFWAVYFPLYDDLKRHWSYHYPNHAPAYMHMSSAVTAGIVSDIICNPMFVVRTRLQTEALHNLLEAGANGAAHNKPLSVTQTARSLYKEGGPLVFWRGMSANLMGLSHVAVQFPVYEQLKVKLKGDKAKNSALDLFLASAMAKMIASSLTYPHEVIRSRMMDARTGVGFVQTCQRIYAHEGLLGFYAGLPVTLLRVIPNTCITFASYELLLQWAEKKIQESRGWS